MTFVVTEQCIRCKFMDCIKPCPVDCFYEGPEFLVINPDECIDCSVCVTECPVNAIYQDKDLPADQREFLEINRAFLPDMAAGGQPSCAVARPRNVARRSDEAEFTRPILKTRLLAKSRT